METLTRRQVAVAPWQSIPQRMAELGLTVEDGMTKAWFVSPAGELRGGAAAINAAMRTIWWARPLTWLYRLPGLRQLEDRVYQWIADHRMMMPGSTAACALPASNPEKQTKSS